MSVDDKQGMRVTHRISTGQFEYVEVTQEIPETTTPEIIVEVQEGLVEAFKPKPINSLPEKEWKRFIERILQGEPNHIDELEKCSPTQKTVINEIKRGLDRLAAREGRELRDRFNEDKE